MQQLIEQRQLTKDYTFSIFTKNSLTVKDTLFVWRPFCEIEELDIIKITEEVISIVTNAVMKELLITTGNQAQEHRI